LKIILVLGLAATMALAGTVAVSAQGRGPGGQTGNMTGGQGHVGYDSTSLAAIAKALNMTVADLTTQLQAGAKVADLADKAGVDLQKVRDAAEAAELAARKAQIEQQVTDGKITREQADWLLQGIDKGYTGGGLMGRGMPGLGRDLGGQTDTEMEAAAKVLGMTADQLSTQLWGGRTLADLATKANVKVEDVQAAMTAARTAAEKAQIEQAVKDGKITREQADWMLQGIDKGYGRGAGFMGRGGMGGGSMGRGEKGGTNTKA